MVACPVVFLEGASPSPLPSSVGMDGAGEQVQDFMAPLYCVRCLSFLYLALAVWEGQRRDMCDLAASPPASNGPQHFCAAFFPRLSQDEWGYGGKFVISKLCTPACQQLSWAPPCSLKLPAFFTWHCWDGWG